MKVPGAKISWINNFSMAKRPASAKMYNNQRAASDKVRSLNKGTDMALETLGDSRRALGAGEQRLCRRGQAGEQGVRGGGRCDGKAKDARRLAGISMDVASGAREQYPLLATLFDSMCHVG